jgi:predicted alpha/beta superfamily hydrolase
MTAAPRRSNAKRRSLAAAAAGLLAAAPLSAPLFADDKAGVEFDITVPEGTKGPVYVALDEPVNGKDAWAPDGLALAADASGHWKGTFAAKNGAVVHWKVTRGDWDTVEKGADNGDVANHETKVSGMTKAALTVHHWADAGVGREGVASLSSSVVFLGEMKPNGSTLPKRPIFVWLPHGYDKETERRYPVIYVLDGQNQLDPKRSFQGVTWGLDTSGDAHVAAGHAPFIAVAIDNAREQRADEYLPSRVESRDGKHASGGKLEELVKFILEQIKPAVDAKFRTKPGPDDTGVMGSSFGGMAAFHIGWKHSDKFRRVAAVSPSFWWHDKETKALVEGTKKKPPLRLWVDMGTREEPKNEASSKAHLEGAREIRDACLKLGFVEGKDFRYVEDEGAVHNEAAWAKRLPAILEFLFP